MLIVEEIPKGPTGKVQRIGLAAKLGLASPVAVPQTFVAPRTPFEKMLAERWAEILQVEQVGIHDDFFALGGDSLSVTHVLAHVYEITHLEIEVSRFFEAPTVAEMAAPSRDVDPGRPSSDELLQPLCACPEKMEVPASIAQERLWKLQQALPGMPVFQYPLRAPTDVGMSTRRSWSGASTKSCDGTKFCARPSPSSTVDACRSLRRS